jgi:hypothetical protein
MTQHTPPAKPRLSSPEQKIRRDERVAAIRLRMTIGRELEDRGITTPVEIGKALGMLVAEAHTLLTRRQWREGDVALLQAAAARRGLKPTP